MDDNARPDQPMTEPAPLLAPEERQAPRALVEHALLLTGRVHRAAPDRARAAENELQQWRQISPAHAEAAATAQRVWNATAGESLRAQIGKPPTAQQKLLARRRVTGTLGIAAFLAATGAGGRWYWQQPVYRQELSTGQGQLLAQSLPDASQLDLAANTQASIVLYRDRRVVRLLRGEMRFEVANDASRPFTVETDWGHVRVLGTVFTVAARDGRMHVAVAQGRVAVWSGSSGLSLDETADVSIPSAVLTAGDAIDTDVQGLGERQHVPVDEIADWRQGWLVFRNTRLDVAVARWNDYLRQPLRLDDDAALHDLRISGSYRLRDPQAFLRSLGDMLPIRTSATTDGTLLISRRR